MLPQIVQLYAHPSGFSRFFQPLAHRELNPDLVSAKWTCHGTNSFYFLFALQSPDHLASAPIANVFLAANSKAGYATVTAFSIFKRFRTIPGQARARLASFSLN